MMNRFPKLGILLSSAMLLSFGACKKDEAKTEAPVAETQPAPAAAEPPVAEEKPTEPAAEETTNYLYVEISHAPAKEGDPVKVNFPALKVVSADFDPANLEGATAELEIDLSQIDSGVPKRDAHLVSADYFDSANFPKAVVKVKDVKLKAGSTYSATADVNVHGVDQTWPVEFEVVDRSDSGVTIVAKHKFSRLDFGIGKAEGDSTATDVVATLKLTLENS